jgi:hypothetical protein
LFFKASERVRRFCVSLLALLLDFIDDCKGNLAWRV